MTDASDHQSAFLTLDGNYASFVFKVMADANSGVDVAGTMPAAIADNHTPFILTNNVTLTDNTDGTTTISGLQISDTDAGVTTVSITATTAGAASGTSVSPVNASGSLASVNATLGAGITYHPGASPPASDNVTLTASDNFGASETFNFVFNQSSSSTGVTLVGTSGNDVIFATGGSDVLTGGGGQDQFVFKPTTGSTAVQHTITDFSAAIDTIDLRQFAAISASAPPSEVQVGNDTLVTLDSHDTLLLKNVAVSSLHTSDFILHV